MEKRGERLRAILAERKMSIRELSRRANIGQSTVQAMIENNFKDSSIDRVIAIANALEIKVENFIPEAKPNNGIIDGGHTYSTIVEMNKSEIYEQASRSVRLKEVDYYGEISAGELTSVVCESSGEQIELPNFIFGKYASRADAFVMKTNGESMNKVIPNGSYVICVPVEKHELKNGDIVIYSYENESSMKRYYQSNERIIFRPESHNPDFIDFAVDIDTLNSVKIDAKVIAYHVILE